MGVVSAFSPALEVVFAALVAAGVVALEVVGVVAVVPVELDPLDPQPVANTSTAHATQAPATDLPLLGASNLSVLTAYLALFAFPGDLNHPHRPCTRSA